MHKIVLTLIGGTKICFNTAHIVSFNDRDQGSGTRILTGYSYQIVSETVSEIIALIDKSTVDAYKHLQAGLSD